MHTPRVWRAAVLSTLAAALIAAGCGKAAPPAADGTATADVAAPAPTSLTVYSGRSKALVQGIFDGFQKETGITVNVRYGKTTALANTIIEEGDRSPADVFFAQDAGALGALAAKGRFAKLPEAALSRVDKRFRSPDGTWIGTSGRARTVAYNTDRLKPEDLPASIKGFTDPKWKGRIGWPPMNASFQAFVTALRRVEGDAGAEAWLRGIQANEPKVYPKNTPAVKAVAAGEVDVAFVNHYYLHRLKAGVGDKPFPAANHYLSGDVGSLMNVAGVGILKTTKAEDAADELVKYLLSDDAQRVFAEDNYEYPLAGDVAVAAGVAPLSTLKLPAIELGRLDDIEATLDLLRKSEVLP